MDTIILAYPDKVSNGAKLWHVCEHFGIQITNNPQTVFDYAIYWCNKTNSMPDWIISQIAQKMNVININCVNVLKSRVDKIWEKSCGYSITINPEKYQYEYVRKSQLQYRSHTGEVHDGIICDSPQKPDKKFVYQRLIDTSVDGGRFRTLRLPIFKKNIPCIIVKDSKDRFKEAHSVVEVEYDIFNYIDGVELYNIRKFCRKIGLDYGELDILRDNETERIYVVDVNNIAGDGIFGKLYEGVDELKTTLAETFKKEFL